MTKKAKIYYFSLTDEMRKEEKLDWFKNAKIDKIPFELITPDPKNNWLNITDNDFEELIPVCSKDVKAGKSEKAIFKLYSLGVVTNRDEWSYDFDKRNLEKKAKFFIDIFTQEKERWKKSNKTEKTNDFVDRIIKWTSELENHLVRNSDLIFDGKNIIESSYRPFTKQYFYFDKIYTHRVYQNEKIFGLRNEFENKIISVRGISAEHLVVLATNKIFDLGYLKIGNGGTSSLPFYHYNSQGQRLDNITDWAVKLFQEKYPKLKEISPSGVRGLIFHYVYGVLHNPAYRAKYEQNLKRDFPRIPLYEDFDFWAEKGKALMELHLNYDSPLAPKGGIKLQRIETELKKGTLNKPKLKADKETGIIYLDQVTSLEGVPPIAFEYKLGNRCALEWILDQYKEKKPTDPTIREKFNTYRFADYKEQVIELLQRVCTVSVKTMEIIGEMEAKK